ncbi:MAG TPA: Ig-like domain-containing protein [Longimicrobium sp.]|nr:Ig-like domain-containing protein [Longimicrobium sp.]
MKRILPAALLALAAAACDSPSGGEDSDVAVVVVSPSERTIGVGETLQLNATGRDPNGLVVAAGPLAWRSLEPAIAQVSATGLVEGLSPGTARIEVAASGRADTATVHVAALAANCNDPGAAPQLAVGQSLTVSGPAAAAVCLDGLAAGAEYVLVPFHASEARNATLSVSFAATNVRPVTGPPTPALLPSFSQLAPAPGLRPDDGGYHARLNREAARALAPLVPAARAAFARRAPSGGGLRMSHTAPPPPSVGSEFRINVGQSFCAPADYRGGRVVAVGQRALVVADTANPANGLTAEDYAHIAATFDTLIYPVGVANFGEPQDVDGNGRSIIFYTRAVNELTPRGSGSVIGGFFYGRDLFPHVADGRFPACAGSNYAEIFYMLVPDPTGVVNGNVRPLEYVQRTTLATVGHEFQHLISASRRLYVVPGVDDEEWAEETFLNEGLSHIAEELLFHRVSGLQARANLDAADLPSGSRARTAFDAYQQQNYRRFEYWLRNPEKQSPYAANDSLGTRGAIWDFLRYAADRRGDPERGLWMTLVNNDRVGLANLEFALGTDPRPWIRDWAVAGYTDDAVATVPALQKPSWDHRSLYASYPLLVRTLSSGTTASVQLVSGGSSFLRAGVQAGQRASLEVTSAGAVPPATFFLTLVRTR